MLDAKVFDTYVKDVERMYDQDLAEANLTNRFATFVHDAFAIEPNEIEFEKSILLGLKQRGRTDILLGDLVFEFKRGKNFAKANRNQLRDYLQQMQRDDQPRTGFFTDGLTFEVYRLSDGEFKKTDKFNLKELTAESAFVRLDAYLFSQHNQKPTVQDVVARFGASSPTFLAIEQTLKKLLDQVDTTPMIETWRLQWQRLLSRVYGEAVGDNDLYIRHTYLCQFAKLLSYASLKGIPNSADEVKAVINGSAFNALGVDNIGEADFFSWVLMPAIQAEATTLFHRLAEGLIVYDLNAIDQDLLKQLYQNLVDPKARHDLGEYYTPDWLAELTLETISYQAPQSLYDPTCGSGSFLFSAIRRLARLELTGWELVQFVTNNVVGTDVHPLAVTVARMNYLLALSEHLRAPRPGAGSGLITIPVFMADALLRPLENEGSEVLTVPVESSFKQHEVFQLPYESIRTETMLTELIGQMEVYSDADTPTNTDSFLKQVQQVMNADLSPGTRLAWRRNLELLARLKREDRNSIWAYILKNMARPLVLAQRQFDVIVGNPPWLSYRYIKNTEYQKDVKKLYQYYDLLESSDAKLFTQMDLSSLFYALMRDRYLKTGGTLAFVMPRAVITGAKQHRPFQRLGFTHILDLQDVTPLFNVPTCVLIQRGDVLHHSPVPATVWQGKLPAHEMDLDAARPLLTSAATTIHFVDSDVRSSWYYDQFFQGATLVPRNFCFVKPADNPNSPTVVSDPEADKEAKVPYKGVQMRGDVADDFLYATLLSKHLLPFGYDRLHMVALPVLLSKDGLQLQRTRENFADAGQLKSWSWFEAVSAKWDELKKSGTKMTFAEQLNYRNKIVTQNPAAPYKVIYNATGSNIAACVINNADLSLTVHDRKTRGFIVDYKTYHYDTSNHEEAHYLCALLNAPCVSLAIKDYQPRGLMGPRGVERMAFEACAIPPFDPASDQHRQLAALSQAAHQAITEFQQMDSARRGVVALRSMARSTTKAQLDAIDTLAKAVLGL